MKELDFDELDRAVNSLMTNAPKAPLPPKKDEEQTLTITPTLSDDAAPSLDTLDKKVSQITGQPQPSEPASPPVVSVVESVPVLAPSRPVNSPSVATRRGRFMDMVRPNAGQSASKSTAESVRPVSRQGATLEPTGPLMTDIITPSSNPTTDKKPEAPQKQPEQAPVHFDREPDTSSKNTSDSEWPDPLDMMIDTPTKKEASPAVTPAPVAKSNFGDDVPLSSPFLPDTVVEKRPLGGVQLLTEGDHEKQLESGMSDSETNTPDEDASKTDVDVSKQLPADPSVVKPDTILPVELSDDLMALESDANTMAMPAASEKAAIVADQASAMQPDKKAPAVKPEKEEEREVPEVLDEPAEPKPSGDSDAKPASTQPSIPAGPISIPQQYREEPSTGDKGNGAIYDTDTYHQPLAHPKKKKSGWMWVVWILVFLAIGAAGGAALYFLGVF